MRVIPQGVVDRAGWRNTLLYRFTPDLSAVVEYNPRAGEVGPLANLRLWEETPRRPALSLGTSSDRIGTPFGRAYYATLSRDLGPRVPVSLYASAFWGSFDDEWLAPFGAAVRLGRRWSFTPQFDGHAAHGLVSYAGRGFTVTGLLVRWRHPGLAVSFGF